MAALPLVLDTDIGTDVDDALALAYAIRSPAINLRAVTTVSGNPARRAQIAARLLRLAGRGDVEVAAGLAAAPPEGRSVWSGREGEGLLDAGEEVEEGARAGVSARDGVSALLAVVAEGASGRPAALATVGMQTNLAAALDRDPLLPGRLSRLAVMGGRFSPGTDSGGRPLPVDRDHNLNADPAAAVLALNTRLPTLYVPVDVTARVVLTRAHLETLRHGDELCRALATLVDRWPRRASLPDDHVAVLHDPLTVAALVEPRFVTMERMPVTVALVDGVVRTFLDPVAGVPADVVTAADGPGFAEHWLSVVTGG